MRVFDIPKILDLVYSENVSKLGTSVALLSPFVEIFRNDRLIDRFFKRLPLPVYHTHLGAWLDNF